MLRVFCVVLLGLLSLSDFALGDDDDEESPRVLVAPVMYDFGVVPIGEAASREFRLRNVGEDDLRLFAMELGENSAFFTIGADNCANELERNDACRVQIDFSPLAAGSWENSLIIYSNDPKRPEYVIPLRGASMIEIPGGEEPGGEEPGGEEPGGEEPGGEVPGGEVPGGEVPGGEVPGGEVPGDPPAVSEILLLDSVAPEDDRVIPFGSVSLGTTKRKTMQIINRSANDLTVASIASPSPPFVLDNDYCSATILGPQSRCAVQVTFTPEGVGEAGTDLTIETSHPQDGRMIVALSGVGTPASADFPAPRLIFPANAETNLKDSVSFRWYKCRNSAGRMAAYRVYADQSPNFSGSPPRLVSGSALRLGLGVGALLLLLPAAPGGKRKSRHWLFLLLAAILLVAACGEDIEDSSTATVSGLEANTTYYWRIVAEYDDGIETPSEIRSFTTR